MRIDYEKFGGKFQFSKNARDSQIIDFDANRMKSDERTRSLTPEALSKFSFPRHETICTFLICL